jgi:hypothetical protein
MHMTRAIQLGILSVAATASLTLQPLLLDQQHLRARPLALQQPVSRQYNASISTASVAGVS